MAAQKQFSSAFESHMPSVNRLAVVSRLELVRTMSLEALWMLERAHRQPITTANAWPAKPQLQTRWDSELRIGLPTCASLQPPTESLQVPSLLAVLSSKSPPLAHIPLLSLRVRAHSRPSFARAPPPQIHTSILDTNSRRATAIQ